MYTVKQVAEKMGISAYTLRFYDKEGLFPHVARDENNVRHFSDEDLGWVNLVQCLRETGMPLAEIKAYIQLCLQGDSTISTRHKIIQDQVLKAEEDLVAMEKRINMLKMKVAYYNDLLNENIEDACNPARQVQKQNQPEATGKPSSSMPA